MKFQYLGTAAAEGCPALWCECEKCRRSRKLGGRNIRTRSQAIINDELFVDFPADTYWHIIQNGIDMTKVKSCIITHSHEDHLYPDELVNRMDRYFCATPEAYDPMEFYSDKSGYDMIQAVIDKYNISENEIKNHLLRCFEAFETNGYKVIPVRASHDKKSDPVVYIIEKDDKRVFYVNDTSDFIKESWDFLKGYGKKLDFVTLDCTSGCNDLGEDYVGHMNVDRCKKMRDKLIEIGIADDKTIFALNHFSHNGGNVVYDDFVKIAEAEGFIVSYDGMIIEI